MGPLLPIVDNLQVGGEGGLGKAGRGRVGSTGLGIMSQNMPGSEESEHKLSEIMIMFRAWQVHAIKNLNIMMLYV